MTNYVKERNIGTTPYMTSTFSTKVEYVYLQFVSFISRFLMKVRRFLVLVILGYKKQSYWHSLFSDIQDYVLKCQKCQVHEHERLQVGGLLHSLDYPRGKRESMSTDLLWVYQKQIKDMILFGSGIMGLPKTNGYDFVW